MTSAQAAETLVLAVHRAKEAVVLVLTRRSQESIVIAHDIVITVLEVRRDQVRLGIQAPPDVQVHRQEVYEAIQAANREAAAPSTEAISAFGGLARETLAEQSEARSLPQIPDPDEAGGEGSA